MSPCQGNALPLRQLGLKRILLLSYYNKSGVGKEEFILFSIGIRTFWGLCGLLTVCGVLIPSTPAGRGRILTHLNRK